MAGGCDNVGVSPQSNLLSCTLTSWGYVAYIWKMFKLSYKCDVFLVTGPESPIFRELLKKNVPSQMIKNSNEVRIQFILDLLD